MKTMKKILFFAAAITVMVGCTNDNVVSENPEFPVSGEMKPISFGSFAAATTRADYTGKTAADMLGDKFVVEGVKSNGTVATQEVVFDHYNVNFVENTANTTTSNSSGWEYVAQAKHDHASIAAQSIKYWDYGKSQYDFIAYSAGSATPNYTATYDNTKVQISAIDASKMNGVDSDSDGKIDQGAYTIKGKATELAKVYIADMVTAYRDESPSDYQKEVEFKFRSLSAKVRLALYETVPGYSVKDVVFYTSASAAATDGEAHLYTTGGDVFNEEGTYVVYFPTTGSTNTSATDYNKAHVEFQPATSGTGQDKAFGALDNFVSTEVAEAADDYLGRSSNAATYAGTSGDHYYTIVIPNETGAVLNLKVDYTLISTDGSGEEINVTGATAQVPAEFANWKSGYAYTYIFKISQNTNGVTNPTAGPAGLYPITFDAVVLNSEVDGIQETITTVATPSITTYAKGAVVTTNDEYTDGDNIYVMVNKGGSNVTLATTGTINAKLYTVTLESGAAQTINEASVANALANGTEAPTGTWTVTDANGKKMVVTANSGLSNAAKIAADDAPDGNAVTINGAVFTGAASTTYVFEFIDTADGNKKYYKIIKVQ